MGAFCLVLATGLALLSGTYAAEPPVHEWGQGTGYHVHLPKGFKKALFIENFALYVPGSLPSTSKWAFDLGTSYPGGPEGWGTGEVQTYTASTDNIVITTSGTLQITPVKDPVTGNWTSSRIETVAARDIVCPPGQAIRIEAWIKLGDLPVSKQLGIWPAFWMMSSAYRGNYWNWPMVGEIDILENVNGASAAWQTIHCGKTAPGPCNEYTGITNKAAHRWSGFHRFSVDIDRTNPGGSWKEEQIVWRIDGKAVFTVKGSRVDDEKAWTALTRTPKYILLNVAVGGSFPDVLANPSLERTPNNATVGGEGSAMEVRYVAVFST
ncbi:glycoside hydrolase family 16 protein [Neurospora crassa]|uniref:Secreted glucosidase n=1 Tax=Neurospora crassa (strain ATCC 24698 / 74-OR23-1A / CBS 708.71 / DSM 1257 / FGSC 987) TaxID=367110 RepID=Q7S3Q8_NEUCR|nr:secreted glucosidase [Neurospora crassa OR74A]EAA30171.1 secreted glucosidase [Neurospora crassa OR74A]KHE81579.1 glycoside hydrolase family 16 protein [Neurospora crassa]|eukprot:XP_959407.1 secreted glucosidase [Neurospora crassa OR74A]